MKICTDCCEERPFSDFYKRTGTKDGLFSYCKGCHAERQRAYRATPAGKASSSRNFKKWYATNREYDLSRRPKWREENRGRYNEYMQGWRAVNKTGDRDPRIDRGRLPRDYKSLVKAFYGNKCLYPGCAQGNIEVDHVVPLSLNGEHSLSNMQTLCRYHNASKGGRSTNDYRYGRVMGEGGVIE